MRAKIIALFGVLALSATSALAAEIPPTIITVEKMHCTGCAKKIGAKLYEVSGVIDVKADVNKKTLVIVSKKKLSPKALWEAVESANDKPVLLDGPNGKFKEKPKL
jgi:copper chaperone CopZ